LLSFCHRYRFAIILLSFCYRSAIASLTHHSFNSQVCPDLAQKKLLVGTEEDEEESAGGGEGGGSDASMEGLPFVCQSFAVAGAK
jgi:hypothetical protein